MSKAIYSFKIFMLQNQFQCQAKEKMLTVTSAFFNKYLRRTWFRAPFAIKAP